MDGDLLGADELGRVHPSFSDGKPVAKQVMGSIETQMFLKIEAVINKPLRSATGAWMAEVDGVEKGTHMQSILSLLSDDEAYRVLAAIRMDHDPKSPHEKWCLLMHNRGTGTGQRDLGAASFKERHIVSPSRRIRNGNRRITRQGADDGDIRFFEMERSQSRDRYDGAVQPLSTPYTSPSVQRYDMNPTYYQRTPGRPMSLLNNLTLNFTPGIAGGGGVKTRSSGTTTLNPPRVQSNQLCSNHQKGECKYGSKCRFKHEVGVGLESTTSTNDQL